MLKKILVLTILTSFIYGQDGTELQDNYWGDVKGFLNRQARVSLDLVSHTLDTTPPQLPEPLQRKKAMLMIDGILHYKVAPELSSVQNFHHQRIKKALEELKQTEVDKGCMIWKMYDHGFIVRTQDITVAFDLIRGYSAGDEGFPVSDKLMKEITEQCDILFITHRHKDHADKTVAKLFLEQGKPVVAQQDIWKNEPVYSKISHLNPIIDKSQNINLKEKNINLEVVVYPGHQGDTPNNVYLIKFPDELSICHTGDQYNSDDFAWIDKVKESHDVNVLMPNCWTQDIERVAEGFNPELIITGHENELGHTIDHREPYWLSYDRLNQIDFPFLMMTWGESFYYNLNDQKMD